MKEVILNEKEDRLSSGEITKETSVTNITVKGEAGKDVEKETVIEKDVEKNVCPMIKEGAAGVEKIVPIVKEKKEVGTVVPSVNEKATVEKVALSIEEKIVPISNGGKVIENVVLVVKEEKVLETIFLAVK